MDIEKLRKDLLENSDPDGPCIEDDLMQAATALSTLQTENAKLRESRDHWKRLAHELSEGVNGKDAEHERLQAENEKLREKIEDARLEGYAKGLGEMSEENEKLRAELEQKEKYYEQMVDALAATESAELEQVKRERDAIEQDFRAFTKQWWEEDSGFPCRWCKFERQGGCEWKVKHPGEICAGRAFECRGQKEE